MQALDYAYTLQGWLKGVNSDALDAYRDIGKDGDVNLTEINPNQFVGADQFGFSLGYYQGDYTPVGGANAQFLSNMAGSTFATAQVGLYNGNISHMVNSSRHVNDQSDVISMGFAYQYDQLNRIRNMVTYEGLDNNTWSSADSPTASSSYTYDKNGNLETLNRSNRNNAPFDLFTYNPVDGENNNKLLSVSDAHTDPLTESTDIDVLAGPYTYDQIGNLTSDLSEEIANIEWTASGKVRYIDRAQFSLSPELHFKYDPTGNRILKMVRRNYLSIGSTEYFNKYYYICDAQGNIMAVYYKKFWYNSGGMVPDSYTYKLIERPIYGSSRIANNTEEINLVIYNGNENPNPESVEQPEILSHTNGYKHFELTNHLGNVMAVVSDKRTPVLNATATAIESFQPELLIAKDYYPFGMEMSGRYDGVNGNTEPLEGYRYGFNGMEKDDEITGHTDRGNHYTAPFWEYDARIGRRWNLDPKPQIWSSDYSCFANNPIFYSDPLGDSIKNNMKEQYSNRALELFMGTRHGRNYIGRFAAKGQTIAGHTYDKDGKYHSQGFDLYLSDISVPTSMGEVDDGSGMADYDYGPVGLMGNGRYRINANLNSNLNMSLGKVVHGQEELEEAERMYAKSDWRYKKAYYGFIAGKVQVLTHELFIHVESGVIDYSDDGIMNNSHQNGKFDHEYIRNSWNNDVKFKRYSDGTYKPVIININHGNLYLYEGWYVVKSVHKWLGTGYTDKEIYDDFYHGLGR